MAPRLPPDLGKRIKKGEFKLPLYADLPSMTEHERRAIWGLMVGEEAKTRVPLIETYTESGFDPARDLLQSYIMLRGDPLGDAFVGMVNPQERAGGEGGDAGGLLVDWDLKTTLEGLYCAGDALFAANYHYHAAVTGRYAGERRPPMPEDLKIQKSPGISLNVKRDESMPQQQKKRGLNGRS